MIYLSREIILVRVCTHAYARKSPVVYKSGLQTGKTVTGPVPILRRENVYDRKAAHGGSGLEEATYTAAASFMASRFAFRLAFSSSLCVW